MMKTKPFHFWDETHLAIPDHKVNDIQFEGPISSVANMQGLAGFDVTTSTTVSWLKRSNEIISMQLVTMSGQLVHLKNKTCNIRERAKSS
jgi:hypothetical protein